jgi:hypothetical protein
MAAKGTSTAEHGEQPVHREHEVTGKPQLVLVDLSRRQTPRQVKRLRKGRGTLVTRIDEIVEELVRSGTVKAEAQPVVIVVREKVSLPWPFANMDYDDEEEEDEEDEDEDEDEDD